MTISRLHIPVLALALTLAACADFKGFQRRQPPPISEEAQAQINLGAALLMQGEYVKALPELLRARELAPKNADLENYLGLAYYYGQREYELAIESYQKALALNPGRTDVRNNLGLVYLEMEEYDQALNEFNICLQDLVYQNKHLPLTNIGLTWMRKKDYDQALDYLNRAVEIAPGYANAYKEIGKVHIARGNYDFALDYLVNAARLNDSDPDAFMELGDLYGRLGKPDEAAQAYSQAAFLAPNTPLALEAQRRARQIMGF